MTGIDPNGTPPPAGGYVVPFGPPGSGDTVSDDQTSWTQTTVKSTLKAGPLNSYGNAQTLHQETVTEPISQNTNGINTTVAGVTSNVTGSTASTDPDDVGTAVAILDTTVQAGSQPPEYVVVTSTQNVDIPNGAKTMVANLVAGGGGGARGAFYVSGPGNLGGGGGVGGWQKNISVPTSSLPGTIRCVIGDGGLGATANSTPGANGQASSITSTDGTVVYLTATGGQGGQPHPQTSSGTTYITDAQAKALAGAPGSGNGIAGLNGLTYGGYGGEMEVVSNNSLLSLAGSPTPSAAGGTAGTNVTGGPGGDGEDNTTPSVPGMGGSGGGGGYTSQTGANGGKGGNGGYPGGAGGGGGGCYTSSGSNGNGGDGAPGEIWLTFVF